MREFFWRAWPWTAWLLPGALLVVKFASGTGGWEMLFALMASPVLIPLAGVLGLTPRFVLRKRGHGSAPIPVAVLMIVHWWAMALWLFSMPGSGDSGSLPSMLTEGFSSVNERYAMTFFGISFLLIPLSYLAALVCAFALRPQALGEGAAGRASGRRATIAVWTAFAATPLLVAALTGALDFAAAHGERDFAGNQEAQVQRLSVAEVRELHVQRWDEAQRVLQPVREAIAQEGWEFSGPSGASENVGPVRPTLYRIEASWSLRVPASPEALREAGPPDPEDPRTIPESVEQARLSGERLNDVLTAQGWTEHVFENTWDDPCRADWMHAFCVVLENADGYTLHAQAMPVEASGDAEQPAEPGATVYLSLSSPGYWLEGVDADWDEARREDGGDFVFWTEDLPPFAADEWPELIEIEIS